VKRYRALLSWIVIAVTVPLLVMLALNQFQWLQELQKREQKRIQYSMITSAQALTERLQEEILFLPSLLHFREEDRNAISAVLAERYQFWTYYALSPSMIKAIYLVDKSTNATMIWNGDAFIASSKEKAELDDYRNDVLEVKTPVFLGRDSRFNFICVFDRQIIIDEVIPAIAQQTLDSTDIYAYRIIDTMTQDVIYGSESPFASPDLEVPLLENLRVPLFRDAPNTMVFPGDDIGSFDFIKERSKIDPDAPKDALDTRAFRSFILQIANQDGSLVLLSRKATVQNALLSFGVVVILGLLMIALAEASRRSASLAKSQQEFIATITHELKTPLAVISSAAQNLADGLIKDQKKAEQYGTMIRKEASRLGVSIEHFLLYSNTASLSRMKPVLCDVSELVETSLKFTEEDRTRLQFRTEVIIPDEPLFVLGDRIALESVFQNLAHNIIRHASSGKYMGIIVSAETANKNKERSVVIKIRDRGPGIPSKEQKSIFEPFVRGAAAIAGQIPGNGIGLNLVKRIVTLNGGTISLESKTDAGSTFTVSLPESKGGTDAEQDIDD
jgi:signal transduction histidine kinase